MIGTALDMAFRLIRSQSVIPSTPGIYISINTRSIWFFLEYGERVVGIVSNYDLIFATQKLSDYSQIRV